ncbi:MAG: serine hydrolase domain-containing protein [Fusicatenibacter sp.]|nr:beta-lactamase family protein [Fusicatenibacter sp.]
MDEKQKRRLQEIITESVEKGEISGCSLLVQRDDREEVYLEAGWADIEEKKPIRRDTIFRLFSMSKPVTAAAMMILLERGLIDLCDPVAKYLPGFQGQKVEKNGELETVHREMNLMDLLHMTSGLVYDGENEAGKQTRALFAEVIEGLDEGNGGKMGTVEFANRLGQLPLSFQPGTAWCYGTSADVAGAVVEVVSGMRFGDFLEKELFEPLEMRDTGFYVPAAKKSRLAKVYECREGEPYLLYLGHNLGIRNSMDRRPAFESGGAGLVSTIDDYLHFASMLQNGGEYQGQRILENASVEFMTKRKLDKKQQEYMNEWAGLEGFTYGNFMRILREPERAVTLGSPGEYGWDGWLGCYFANAPKEKQTLLLMTQKKDSGTFALTRKIRNIVYSAR